MEGKANLAYAAFFLALRNPFLYAQIHQAFPLLVGGDVVDEVVVHVACAQALQRRGEQLAEIRRAAAARVGQFGGDEEIVAHAQLLDRPAQRLFYARVRVGRVEVVYAQL